MRVSAASQLLPHVVAQILRQHFGRAVLNVEQGTVGTWKDVGRHTEVIDGQPVAVLVKGELGILRRQDHLVVDFVDELPGDLLEHAEVEDE